MVINIIPHRQKSINHWQERRYLRCMWNLFLSLQLKTSTLTSSDSAQVHLCRFRENQSNVFTFPVPENIIFKVAKSVFLKLHLQPLEKSTWDMQGGIIIYRAAQPPTCHLLLASCLSVEHLCLFCMRKLFFGFAKMSFDVELWVCGFSVGWW